jgi:hypothetical protein
MPVSLGVEQTIREIAGWLSHEEAEKSDTSGKAGGI